MTKYVHIFIDRHNPAGATTAVYDLDTDELTIELYLKAIGFTDDDIEYTIKAKIYSMSDCGTRVEYECKEHAKLFLKVSDL